MDRKTTFILNLVKYGGYIAVFWVAFNNAGQIFPGFFIPLFLVFALDNIRTYYFTAKFTSFIIPSFYIQMVLAFLFIFLEGSPLGAILLIILIAESLISTSRPHGDYIFFMAVAGFLAVSAAGYYWRSILSWDNMAAVLINCLFLFFAYGVSYMARRQLEERERAEEALEELDRSRSDLEAAYLKVVEMSKEREQLVAAEERSRLARELHDTLAHSLTAIVVSLEAGKKLLEKDPGRALEEIEKSQEQARRGLEEVRLTVKALRPLELEEMNFRDALKNLARDYSGSGIVIDFQLEEQLLLSPTREAAFYRIIQESITNSVRHGKAGKIKVRIWDNETSQGLEVRDDGKGCKDLIEGHGLRGIRERASALGGETFFENRGDDGFLVKVIFGSSYDE
ncbi:MAG TPA: sensor histidine kinase [Firmicutes bacterium]|nr:sensor histidine kinase [Bacillota bacterium]